MRTLHFHFPARLVFMVAFFVIINGQVISFASSLIFVLLAIVFMASPGYIMIRLG